MTEHALVIGEALVDVVRHPDGAMAAHPGGSPANVAIGLARLGRDAELLAWLGLDDNGRLVRDHLDDAGVTLVPGSESAQRTSVATAFVDADGVAQYDFDLTWAVSPHAAPRRRPLVVHTGSIAAVIAPGGAAVARHVETLRSRATITYDPNARPGLMGDPRTARQTIERMVAMSDVVKVSDEDLHWLAPDRPHEWVAHQWLELGPAMVIVTRGGSGATGYLTHGRAVAVQAPQVQVVDTVGAGDSFMGGLIDGLWSAGLLGADKREALHAVDDATVREILDRCVRIAAITVSRAGANPPSLAELGEA